ncbi:protein FAR1-RELATED SEQUENCE 5-like [Salvia splendens]|uniref:protein FAR1-RELATED SEQUENCE 5-like n=1 Tax=Salvia splendens TaxID=180675 RepID=UPI001C27EE45|nr:protein FAR1-RELATED SEQUENCE 5-like [Salvia splendens]
MVATSSSYPLVAKWRVEVEVEAEAECANRLEGDLFISSLTLMEIGSPPPPNCDNYSSSDESVDNTNCGDLHTPDCPNKVKPFVGRNFPTLEKAIQFYENYGRHVGFDTLKCGSKKIGQLTIWFYMACSREGEKRVQDKQARRRRKSKKCGCKARVAFKFDSDRGYVIKNLNEEHNHPMVLPNHQKFMRLNRVLDDVHQKFITDCAGVNIGPSLTFKLLTELMGGYESVGCTVLDVRNYTRDIRRYAEGHDAQMILDELRKKKKSCDAFTYEYKVDSSDRMLMEYSMIFAPFTGKDNHGRAMTFGAGLLCSESADSFSWLFRQFVKCMGVAPKLIITDQDLGMKVAVEEVLVNTRHRWCMWHIMAKVAEKVPKSLLGNTDFKKELNSCVWSELIESTEFEDTWHKIMEEYGLEDTDWFSTMFRSRQYWVPAYFRDFPASSLIKTTSVSESQNSFFTRYSKSKANLVVFLMNFNNALEAQRYQTAKLDYMDANTTSTLKTQWPIEKYASTIFTDSAFKEIQEQILEAYNHCSILAISNESTHDIYKVLDHFSNTWNVTYSELDFAFHCGCKMFLRTGLVCCHIFLVLKHKNFKLIPDNLIGGRWLKSPLVKSAHGVDCEDVSTHIYVDEKKKASSILLGEMLSLYQAVSIDIDQTHELTSILRDVRQQIFADGVVLSAAQKKQRIESFYGGEKPLVVDVHPPEVVKTKGHASRLQPRLEKAMRLKNKPVRQCKKCHEWGHHDSRNCDKIKEKELQRSRRESEI